MTSSIRKTLLLLFTPLCLTIHMAPLSAKDTFNTEIHQYKEIDGDEPLILKRYTPQGATANSPKPAIVFFFGGGWNGGDISHLAPQAEHLASRGMIALCVQYRTKKSHKVTPNVCLEDAWDAMRYVRKNAQKLGIDPKRIIAGGGSAGGHLAAAVAFCPLPSKDYKNVRPQALVLFNPVVDNGPNGYGHERVSEYWESFSPFHNVDDFLPPTIFFLGDSDKLVPVETGEAFAKMLNKKGPKCTLKVFENAEHGFFNKGKKTTDGKEFYDECIDLMDTFLTNNGYLKPKS